MSNTEDTQRIEGLNPGDKAYILTEEQYIKFEKQNDVIADLKFKLKNDAIFQEYSDLENELASLREQLEKCEDKLRFADKNCELLRGHRDELQNELKQQEEVIRELIPIAEYGVYGYMRRSNGTLNWGEQEQIAKAIIEKAKSLTTKDK